MLNNYIYTRTHTHTHAHTHTIILEYFYLDRNKWGGTNDPNINGSIAGLSRLDQTENALC